MSPPVVHIVTSAGGHIELLAAVSAAFSGYRRVWVVQPSLRAEALAAEGEEVIELPEYDRRPLRFAQNVVRAASIVLRRRPRVVVTAGSGATVPFCALARMLGARVVFVETMARVTGPSSSGRVLSRLAGRVVVQWPELVTAYPRATICRPALLRSLGGGNPPAGEGVFVGVGTHSQQFDRLLRIVDEAAGAGLLPKPIVAQGGSSSYRPRNYELRDWLAPDEVPEAIGRARYVICHAGSGLVAGALRAGRRPLVLPRLARHGEHYDDHQTQIVAKLAALGLAIPLDGEIRPSDLAAARAPLPEPGAWSRLPLVEDVLRAELEAVVGLPSEPAEAVLAAAEPVLAPSSRQRRIA